MADTAVVVDVARQTAAAQQDSSGSSSHLGEGKAGGGRGEHGCYFANSSATGSPFMVSGELFLRSTQRLLFGSGSSSSSGSNDVFGGPPSSSDQYLQEQQPSHATIAAAATTHATAVATDNSSAGLLAGLSRDLRDLLLCHPDLIEESGRPFDSTTTTASTPATSKDGIGDGGLPGLASSARVERRLVRRKRVACLEASKTITGCLVTARLNAVQKAAERFREEFAEGHGQLDTRLRGLVLRFAGVASADMAMEDEQTAAEDQHCRKETERLQLAARLASLAATAEHRTRGSVVLRRLPPTHPQHARCLRAATENVRPGFFSRESPFGAVQVLDIYKIENRFLLERFERAAQARGACKVKGLFCHVPDESLEHVVLYGMGGAGSLVDDCGGDGGDGCGSAPPAGWDGDPIDFFWGAPRTKVGSRRGGGGAVTTSTAITGGAATTPIVGCGLNKPLEFPRAFSRHSTLEEEHGYVNDNQECDAEECGVQRHRRPWSPLSAGVMGPLASTRQGQGRRHYTAGEGLTEDGRHRDAVSGLRFLALCRVMIGSMHVAVESSPTMTAHRKGTDGGGGGGGLSSHEYSSPSAADGPLSATFSPPPPPPGQAEFDSVYFPREEEYRLLNEAFVLPEFLVVHRFVAAATPSGPGSRNSTGRGSPSSSAGNSAAAVQSGAGPVSSVVADGERKHTAAVREVSRKGKGSAEKRPTGIRSRERGQQHQPNDGHFHLSDDPQGAVSPPSTSAMPQDAAAVVAGIEAAMESPVLPPRTNLLSSRTGGASSMQWEGVAAPCSLASSSGCAGGDSAFSLSRGGRDGGRSGSLSFELDGGSCGVGGTNDDNSSDGGRGGRRRERDSGRATRNSIVRGVELEFDRFWQEMQRLREQEKTEVTETALSNRRLAQPP